MNAPAKLTVTVGQEVVFLPHTGYEDRPAFGWNVTRVSPSGKMEVTAPHGAVCFYNAQGYEVQDSMNGKVKSYGSRVSIDVAGWKFRNEQHSNQKAAASALNDVKLQDRVQSTYSKEYMMLQVETLEALVKVARAAVELL